MFLKIFLLLLLLFNCVQRVLTIYFRLHSINKLITYDILIFTLIFMLSSSLKWLSDLNSWKETVLNKSQNYFHSDLMEEIGRNCIISEEDDDVLCTIKNLIRSTLKKMYQYQKILLFFLLFLYAFAVLIVRSEKSTSNRHVVYKQRCYVCHNISSLSSDV